MNNKYCVTQLYPNGDISIHKEFDTYKEALDFYESNLGWWFQSISYQGKILKHN